MDRSAFFVPLAAAFAGVALLALGGCGTSASGARDGGAAGAAGDTGTHMTTDGYRGGGSADAGGAPQTPTGFVGTWAYDAGSTTRACPGESPTDAPPDGTLAIAAGASSDQLVVTEPGACALHFTLAGRTAKAAAHQMCGGDDGAGGRITFDKLAWTLTLSTDGQTLTESLAADEILAPVGGAAKTCAYTESGVTLRRL